MRPPESKRPALIWQSGTGREIGKAGSVSKSNNSPTTHDLQAARLRKRFPALSWPLARAVAELAFQTRRARA